ncbi:MAG: peptidoglycan recognition protein family protein [Planctomycetota bacterium]|jgi:hypothetical protein|nr:peptidoglycan recognition protein family protein [Planctomycetota bacterium]
MDDQTDFPETPGLASRREFLAWTASTAVLLLLPGCEKAEVYAPPRRRATAAAYAQTPPPPATRYIYIQQPAPEPKINRSAPVRSAGGKVTAMSRNSWGATAAVPAKMKMMGGVNRITVHHEGSSKPNNDLSPTAVATTLRLIQSQHRARMGAGDIGYHYIIDRSGTVWQGRDTRYQGAHVASANSHNLGVMLLGNFEIQKPASAQLASLERLLLSLLRQHGLGRENLHMHCDFGNTQCPGKNLKPSLNTMKKSLRV